jgi:hypothetical protein
MGMEGDDPLVYTQIVEQLNFFLKPTKLKIWLAVFIAIVHIALVLYSAKTMLCTQFCPEPNTLQRFTEFTLYPLEIIHFTTEFFEDMRFLSEPIRVALSMLASFMGLGILWYLLACIVISLKNLTTHKHQNGVVH